MRTPGVVPARDASSARVVITMPAYNAEATLEKTVADIPPGVADRLILVDDASPDNTAQLARDLGIEVHVHPENRGYGGNQKTCYAVALEDGADIVVMLHPDYQYEPKAVPLLIAPILAGDADMTFGSRFAGLGDPRGGGMPVHRFVGNRVTTVMENVLLGSRFSEMHSGMRAYTRRCLLSLPFLRYSNSFLFDSELLIDAVTTGQRVVEVPIPTRYTEESSSIGAIRSLSYVARSIGYCARRVARHGRRAHRSPIGRRDSWLPDLSGGGPTEPRVCLVCGVRRRHHRSADDSMIECVACGLVSRPERVASGPAARPPSGHAIEDDVAFLDWALGAITAFFVGGRRLRGVGISPSVLQARAAAAGWDVASPVHDRDHEGRRPEGTDALLLVASTAELVEPLGGIRGLRPTLAPEGVLALVLPVMRRRSARSVHELPCGVSARGLERALSDADFRLVHWSRLPRDAERSYRRWLEGTSVHSNSGRAGVALAIARLNRSST